MRGQVEQIFESRHVFEFSARHSYISYINPDTLFRMMKLSFFLWSPTFLLFFVKSQDMSTWEEESQDFLIQNTTDVALLENDER